MSRTKDARQPSCASGRAWADDDAPEDNNTNADGLNNTEGTSVVGRVGVSDP
jgi:hypothetical protein